MLSIFWSVSQRTKGKLFKSMYPQKQFDQMITVVALILQMLTALSSWAEKAQKQKTSMHYEMAE